MFNSENPFESKGKPFSFMDDIMNRPEKKVPVQKKKSKPETGKKAKPDAKALPEKNITCPYCKTVNRFPKGKASRYCGECGKVYFR